MKTMRNCSRSRSRSSSDSYSPSHSPIGEAAIAKDSEHSIRQRRSRSPGPRSHRRSRDSPVFHDRKQRNVSRSRSRSYSPPPRSNRAIYSPPRRRASPIQEKESRERPSRPKRPKSDSPEIILDYGLPTSRQRNEIISPPIKKERPNYGLSGKLAEEANSIQGIALKYSEPMEARLPDVHWRLYVFKDGKQIDLIHLNKQTAYLFGREKSIVDIPIEHPSCSKQHAVLQYRSIETRPSSEEGTIGQTSIKQTKPYILDLESTNGTLLNGQKIESSRYYELRKADLLKFGSSTREYILLPSEDN